MDHQGGSNKHSALMVAAEEVQSEAVKVLLENGALTNLSDVRGFTSLMCALCTIYSTKLRYPEVVKLLLDGGAC